jgi:hypothetical protein
MPTRRCFAVLIGLLLTVAVAAPARQPDRRPLQ